MDGCWLLEKKEMGERGEGDSEQVKFFASSTVYVDHKKSHAFYIHQISLTMPSLDDYL